MRTREVPINEPEIITSRAIRQEQRLLSLDVFRGLTVALMIFVNNAGDGTVSYSQLRHSVWNGCTLTDLVFPAFLFIMGVSIALSLRRRRLQNTRRDVIFWQVLKRSLTIFFIGLLLNALPYFQLSTLRYYGVLQRIALCYLIGSVLYLFSGVTSSALAIVILIAGYWFLLVHVRVPGYGLPGVDVPLLDPSGNLASWLDRALVPRSHMYRHTVYDPEGLLSTTTAVATTLFGVLAASLLRASRSARQATIMLLLGGFILMAAGLLWAHWLPLNKRLWTSSYCLYTAGFAAALLAVLHYLTDGPYRPRSTLTPWLVFGTNALTAYVFSEVLAIFLGAVHLSNGESVQRFLYHLLPQSVFPPPLLSATWSVLFVAVCFLPLFCLYRRKIFLKL